MNEVNYAYHVTDLEEDNQTIYNVLIRGCGKSRAYDGLLVGLPCVFFSTALFNGNLPTLSPYPVFGIPGQKYKRLCVPLQKFEDYKFWHVTDITPPQVRLILTNSEREERLVKGFSRHDICPLDKSSNPYLMFSRGKWYSTDRTDQPTKWVNFSILHDFQIDEVCYWDYVERGTQGPGNPLSSEELLNEIQLHWSVASKKLLSDGYYC